MTQEKWGQLRNKLLKAVGRNNFTTWIEPLEFQELKGGVAVFSVPTNFMGNYVSQNFADLILYELNTAGESVQRLAFRVAANSPARPAAAVQPVEDQPEPVNIELAPESNGTNEALESLQAAPLDARFTFDTFVVGKPNELAHAAARRVSEGGPVTFNPLVLYGGVGLGKTHLMHAIAWELKTKRPELNVLYLSAEQFMYRFVQALRERRMMDFKHLFRSVDVLMVDDVQFIAGKDSTQEEFFHTFNALIDQNKQIVISADRSPDQIDGLQNRITSRLQWGLVVDIHPTDYELRLGILQSKAERIMSEDPSVVLDQKILEFLAHRISSNVRVLEGALTRLFAFATLVDRPVNLEMVQECLADLLRSTERRVTIEEIKRRVADYYHLRMTDLVSARRARAVARPRQVAMFLCKTLTSKSLPEIGRGFGGRDHTTVIHAVRKIEELRVSDSQINDDIENLRRVLEGG